MYSAGLDRPAVGAKRHTAVCVLHGSAAQRPAAIGNMTAGILNPQPEGTHLFVCRSLIHRKYCATCS